MKLIKSIQELKELLQVGSIFKCSYHLYSDRLDKERIVEEIKSNSVKFKTGAYLYFRDKDIYSKIEDNKLNLYFKKDNKLLATFTLENLRKERVKRITTQKRKQSCEKYLLSKYGENYISRIRKRLIDSPSSTISMFFDEETLKIYDHYKLANVIKKYGI
jgi:hypothetical protein